MTMLLMKEMKQEISVNGGEIRKREEKVRTVGKGKEIEWRVKEKKKEENQKVTVDSQMDLLASFENRLWPKVLGSYKSI